MTGPITKSVRDAAMLLDVMAGYDPNDAPTAAAQGRKPDTYLASLSATALQGKRLGLLVAERHLGTGGIEKATSDTIRAAAEEMRAQGAEVIELTFPQELLDALGGSRTTTFEFKRDLNAWLAQPAKFDAAIAALAEPAQKLTLADVIASGKVADAVMPKLKEYESTPALATTPERYSQAMYNRVRAADGLKTIFDRERLDAVIYPEIKATARKVDDKTEQGDNCGISPYTGFPALNVPAGFAADDGMPVGVEFLGLPFEEPKLLGLGYAFEQATHHRNPPTSVPELGR